MFFIKLIRYIKGYIQFSVIGGFAERFINLCGRNNIPLWNFSKQENEITAHTTIKHYKKMRPYVKKTGVHLKIKEKHGLPFLLNRYRKRDGVVIGLVLAILFIGFMSGFIWNIEISGNVTVENERVLSALEQYGVRTGTFIKSIDTRQVERQMMLEIPELSWIAVNIKGSTANIALKERIEPPVPIDEEETPANIIATESGQIKYLEVYDGQALVNVGDTVMKGDIIVSGITESKKGHTMIKQARAKVLAYVPLEITSEILLTETVQIPTGKSKTGYELNILGMTLPLSIGGKSEQAYEVGADTNQASFFGKDIPLAITAREYSFYTEQEVNLTTQQAKEKAVTEILLKEQRLIGEGKIIEKSAVGEEKDGKFIITAQYIIEKDIAKPQNILTIL